MRSIRFALLILFLSSATCSKPEPSAFIQVQGQVTGTRSNLPFWGAQVRLHEYSMGWFHAIPVTHVIHKEANTDSLGHYSISKQFDSPVSLHIGATKDYNFYHMSSFLEDVEFRDGVQIIDLQIIEAPQYSLAYLTGTWTGYIGTYPSPGADSLSIWCNSYGKLYGFNHASLCSCWAILEAVDTPSIRAYRGPGVFDSLDVMWHLEWYRPFTTLSGQVSTVIPDSIVSFLWLYKQSVP